MKPPFKKHCSIYFWNQIFHVICVNRADVGWGVYSEQREKISSDASHEVLGAAVLTALGASKDNVPSPQDLKASSNELLKYFGAKSWKAFNTSASLCGAVIIGAEIEIVPHHHDGKGNFLTDTDKKMFCVMEARTIGRALRTALGI